MENPYQSPLADPDAELPHDDKKPESGGCFLPFLSFLICFAAHDTAIALAIPWFQTGHSWGRVLAMAPVSGLVAWLVLFYAPMPETWQPAMLRRIRHIPALLRHALLWIAMVIFGIALALCMNINA